MVRIVGMVTIGQSPRTDIIPEMKRILGRETRILECGALDRLTIEEVEKLAPKSEKDVLVSRMRNGKEVKLDKKLIVDRIQFCIDRLNASGAALIILLCTGVFPEFNSKTLLIEPSRMLCSIVGALLKKGRIGVIVPSHDQIRQIGERWRQTGLEVFVESFSPYTGVDGLEALANNIKSHDVDLIIMDCIGYKEAMAKKMKKLTGKPVICPHSLIMRMIKELI